MQNYFVKWDPGRLEAGYQLKENGNIFSSKVVFLRQGIWIFLKVWEGHLGRIVYPSNTIGKLLLKLKCKMEHVGKNVMLYYQYLIFLYF